MKQSAFLLNTLQQEFGNQELGEVSSDYKNRNSCSIDGELLSEMYNHVSAPATGSRMSAPANES
jgi:hypothetical protein